MTVDLSVEDANQAIRQDYQTGCQLLEQLGERIEYGSMEKISSDWGIKPERIRKLRQLALSYTPEQLEVLLELCVRYDSPIGIAHLYKLVSLPTAKNQRYHFQHEMVREGWSRAELDRQIRLRYGRRNNAGKKKTVPADVPGLVSQIESQCHNWLRWDDLVEERLQFLEDDRLAELRKLLNATGRNIKKLRLASDELLDTLKS